MLQNTCKTLSFKKCNIHYIVGDHICFHICGPEIAYLENITNLEILPYSLLHFTEALKRIIIIKYFVG